MKTKDFEIYHSDCITKMHEMASQGRQFDLSVFSPPFASLYAYTDDLQDMGNSKESDDEFKIHHKFFVNALFPLIKNGRNVCVHVQQVQRSKTHHGNMGLFDLRGEVIRQFIDAGFIYYGDVSIRKNPQAQSITRKVHQLMFSNYHKDSMVSRPCLLDYLIIFKKPGKNDTPVVPANNYKGMDEREMNNIWIDWADAIWTTNAADSENNLCLPYPVWTDITETNTLNTKAAKDGRDERHICPLQLDLIERCVKLWSNEGETVFSPFGGIGSEGFVSVLHNRKSVSIELKESYYHENIRNHKAALQERSKKENQLLLFQ